MNPTTRYYPDIEALRRETSLIELDPDFGSMLEGKDVMIVGPAETLLGTGQGEIIDSHDLVVRFNTSIQYMPFSSELARDIGARTDILYCNNEVLTDGILNQDGISHDRFSDVCKQAGLKYLVSTNNDFTYPDTDEPELRGQSEFRAFKLFLQQQGIHIGFRMLFSTSAIVMKLMDGYVGRTGFLAIVDLLAYDIRRLNIAGMTFYHKGGHLFFEDCVTELHPMKDHLGRVPRGDIKGHNSYLELELLRKLVLVHATKLQLDEHLKTLLAGPDMTGWPG
jgi:Glycosyltransferase family 29 (sialyltransferase)